MAPLLEKLGVALPSPPVDKKTITDNDIIQRYLEWASYSTSKDSSTAWYIARPYGFRFVARNGSTYIMFLPINPSNLNITTHYATNVIPTLYGTVEEHSEQRYFDIVIEGTTGMAPKFVDPFKQNNPEDKIEEIGKTVGRSSFAVRNQLPIDGFLQKTIGAAAKIADTVADSIDTIRGKMKPNSTGVYPAKTGWQAFHNLYRFFMFYKSDTAGTQETVDPRKDTTNHPLVFFNYKDNNQYSVSIQRFVLRRTADNPMLYNYSIVLRGYNITSVGVPAITQTEKDRLEALGLNGLDNSSVFTKMKSLSGNLKSAVGAANGLIRNLGR